MTQDQAKEAYRQAWMSWCLARTPERKHVCERRMDIFQPYITPGPGVEWQLFAESLPGFVEFWESSVKNVAEKFVKIDG